MERDAVHKALMSLLRQDPKGKCNFFTVVLYEDTDSSSKMYSVDHKGIGLSE